MKRPTKDRMIGIVLLIVAAIIYIMVCQFPLPVINSTGDPGPKLFPTLGVILIIAGSIGLIFQKQDKSEPFMLKDEYKRLFQLALTFVLYAIGLWGIGFLLSTIIMLFVTMTLMAQEKKLRLPIKIGYSLVITIILYLAFTYLLKFKLPSGYLFSLL